MNSEEQKERDRQARMSRQHELENFIRERESQERQMEDKRRQHDSQHSTDAVARRMVRDRQNIINRPIAAPQALTPHRPPPVYKPAPQQSVEQFIPASTPATPSTHLSPESIEAISHTITKTFNTSLAQREMPFAAVNFLDFFMTFDSSYRDRNVDPDPARYTMRSGFSNRDAVTAVGLNSFTTVAPGIPFWAIQDDRYNPIPTTIVAPVADTQNITIASPTRSMVDNFYAGDYFINEDTGEATQILTYDGTTGVAAVFPIITAGVPILSSIRFNDLTPDIQPPPWSARGLITATPSLTEWDISGAVALDPSIESFLLGLNGDYSQYLFTTPIAPELLIPTSPNPSVYFKIVSYDDTTKIVTTAFFPNTPRAITAFAVGLPFEITPVALDLYEPYRVPGPQEFHAETADHYKLMTLKEIHIPLATLQTGRGGNILDYPYVQVQLSNSDVGIAGSNMGGNIPKVRTVNWTVGVPNEVTVSERNFVTLYSGMRQYISASFVNQLTLAIYLPDGELLRFEEDYVVPNYPNPDLQISMIFHVMYPAEDEYVRVYTQSLVNRVGKGGN